MHHKFFGIGVLVFRNLVKDIEDVKLRYKADVNRQSSSTRLSIADEEVFQDRIAKLKDEALTLYKDMLDFGIAKECARDVLPLATQTTLYMKGSIRSWVHYLQIRSAEDTQLEHREIALAILDIFKYNFPIISKALNL